MTAMRCFVVAIAAGCASTAPVATPPGLDAAIDRKVSENHLAGLAIGITKHGRVVYAKGFGTARLGTSTPITSRTVFHTASVTKPFVAIAILQLVEAGKLELDAPVLRYLPYFRFDGDAYRAITVRQMLAHTSGIPDVHGDEDYHWDTPEYDEGALERYVRSAASLSMIGAPGEHFAYSNIAYDILGDVIAKVSGAPFEDYVKTHILAPLGMRDSTLLIKEVDRGLLATPHVRAGDGRSVPSTIFPYNRAHAPSSTLYSNVDDMNRWCRAVLARGVLDGRRIFSPASFELLLQPNASVDVPSGLPKDVKIGLAWFIYTDNGHRIIEHPGSDVGFRADVMIAVDHDVSVVVLSNDTNFRVVREIAKLAMDRMFE